MPPRNIMVAAAQISLGIAFSALFVLSSARSSEQDVRGEARRLRVVPTVSSLGYLHRPATHTSVHHSSRADDTGMDQISGRKGGIRRPLLLASVASMLDSPVK